MMNPEFSAINGSRFRLQGDQKLLRKFGRRKASLRGGGGTGEEGGSAGYEEEAEEDPEV